MSRSYTSYPPFASIGVLRDYFTFIPVKYNFLMQFMFYLSDKENKRLRSVRFQVLAAAGMKMTAFLDIAPCTLVEVDRRFRGAYCLHYQVDE
jgi:hypothetical protein